MPHGARGHEQPAEFATFLTGWCATKFWCAKPTKLVNLRSDRSDEFSLEFHAFSASTSVSLVYESNLPDSAWIQKIQQMK